MMAADAYAAQLQALLPTGPAWPREAGATLTALVAAEAEELARLDERAWELLEETDPRTAYELLGDWERVLGLPDPCTASATTISARQLACWRKLAYQAGQTPAFYIALAASIGFEIEIHEFDPNVDDYDASLSAEVAAGRWRYIWRVHVLNAGTFNHMIAGDPAGTALVEGDMALDLECIIGRARPAHTHVIFSYPEEI
ncbi:MAG: YmfQ family protein [Sphingobium sp.]